MRAVYSIYFCHFDGVDPDFLVGDKFHLRGKKMYIFQILEEVDKLDLQPDAPEVPSFCLWEQPFGYTRAILLETETLFSILKIVFNHATAEPYFVPFKKITFAERKTNDLHSYKLMIITGTYINWHIYKSFHAIKMLSHLYLLQYILDGLYIWICIIKSNAVQ